MIANTGASISLRQLVSPTIQYLQQPITLFKTYQRAHIRPDLMAGLTVAVILLPQAIAFALIAELPPEMGLYAGIVGALAGALWGSSNQLHTGPANAVSLLVFASLATFLTPGTSDYMIAAGLMAVMAGVLQLVMGLARLGMLVNFVSHSVIVGFATGAGILIAFGQIGALLGISYPSTNIVEMIRGIVVNLPNTQWQTAVIGGIAMAIMIILRRINPRLPNALISIIISSLLVAVFNLNEKGVAVIGQLPQSLPPLTSVPVFNLEMISSLSSGALAVAAIGLVQTTAISRSIATQTSQRLDSNQEFVGQGMANIFMGFFSGYAGAGSFARSAVNFDNGARTRMSSIFSALFVLVAMITLGSFGTYLPRSALSAVILITAYGMIDRAELKRIWHGHRGDAAIMVVTLLGTLFLDMTFAVLLGILLSFVLYILRTSTPQVYAVLPDLHFNHFSHQPDRQPCLQLGIIEILGDLYFGAVNHVEEFILNHADTHPEQRFLLLRLHHVNNCDFSGVHMLENVVKVYRDRGGDVFLVKPNTHLVQLFQTTGFAEMVLGDDHILDEDTAISQLFHHVLDPAICIYECPTKVFKECMNLPKRMNFAGIPHDHDVSAEQVMLISPRELWFDLHPQGVATAVAEAKLPLVIDVREPREFRQAHIPEATLIPLSTILSQEVKLPADRPIVLVCRSGRRSRRAAVALQGVGCMNVSVLAGGMLAWEAAALLEAVGD